MTLESRDTEVLIVGAGPVGLGCSLLLSRMGVSNVVVERRSGLHSAPQAHVVSARSGEIFRAAGIRSEELVPAATRPQDQGAVRWVHTLGGPMLGHVELGTPPRVRKMLTSTPTPTLNIPQHRLEPVLYRAARGAGAGIDFDVEWLGSEEVGAGVVSEVRSVETGRTQEIRSRYLLGCDGAGSSVRRALEIGMAGPARVQSYLTVFIEANLREVVGQHPGLLYWRIDPLEPGVFIAHDIDSTWIYMHPYEPQLTTGDTFTPERCRELVRNAIGAPAEFTIREIGFWQMTCQLAERYRAGSVFLAGDSAHRFPPTGGMGMNTGLADALNLSWKIAAVLSGRAGDELLDTYELERRPVAKWTAEKSLENHLKMAEVVEAMGIDPSLPPGEIRELIRGTPEDAERRSRVQAAIDLQAEHFDMMGLDLGHSYERGALVPDGTPEPVRSVTALEYNPTTRPGSRLPHAWVEVSGRRVSTLDLVSLREPVLLCGPDAEAFRDAASGLGLLAASIGSGGDAGDAEGAWEPLRGTGPDGALLVRPDGHVTWRSPGASDRPTAELQRALAALYGGGEEAAA